jgi:hypothetical protein
MVEYRDIRLLLYEINMSLIDYKIIIIFQQ